MIAVLPPGPFPPSGEADVDLGAAMREAFFRRAIVTGTCRERLVQKLNAAGRRGQAAQAVCLLEAILDTWSLGALLEDARAQWTVTADGTALAVLARASSVLTLAFDWTPIGDGPWAVPDADWLQERVGPAASRVLFRHPGDGADLVADRLGLELEPAPPLDLPPVLELEGPDLVARRAEVGRALCRREYAAVHFTSPVPDDAAGQLALGEVRLEGYAQQAYERYGGAGLLAPDAPTWDGCLRYAPPGAPGATLRAIAGGVLLPGPPERLAQGDPSVTGYLVWDEGYRWIPVEPVALHVLQALDAQSPVATIAARLGAPEEAVATVAAELVALGAATGV